MFYWCEFFLIGVAICLIGVKMCSIGVNIYLIAVIMCEDLCEDLFNWPEHVDNWSRNLFNWP